jgi:hypothetical protein
MSQRLHNSVTGTLFQNKPEEGLRTMVKFLDVERNVFVVEDFINFMLQRAKNSRNNDGSPIINLSSNRDSNLPTATLGLYSTPQHSGPSWQVYLARHTEL